MSLSDKEIELVNDNVDCMSDMSDKEIRDLQEESFVSEKEFVCFVLNESGMAQDVVAEKMGYGNSGTVGSYKSRVRRKFEKSDRSLDLKGLFEK